jgi:PGM1 C-terminal domain/Pre ATP-grasp domain
MQRHREFTIPTVRPLSSAATAHPVPEDVTAERFAALQRRMETVDAATRRGEPGRSLVVVPSRTPEPGEAPARSQAYEERLLSVLQMLRDESLRIVYVTSSPVATTTVDYCLSLLPARLRWSARRRLTLVSADDASPRPLSAKLLAQPGLLDEIRSALPDRGLAQLVPYDTTECERQLALALDIPMYGADPRHRHLGTKTGCRELFARIGVPHPLGAERIAGTGDLIAAIAQLRARRPRIAQVVVKLNESVAGRGNAIVAVTGLPAPGSRDELVRIGERVSAMTLEAADLTVDDYLGRLGDIGGIVEERITGADVRSPSVQLNLTPGGDAEIVSTHDQLLGGPSGQSYLGCRFPAEPQYAGRITELARRVGAELARAGVIGRCAIDFVVARDRHGHWRPYAIELNLRKGGTTHPFMTASLLCGGGGHYVASDHLPADGLSGETAIARLADHGLAFDPRRGAGVVLHMLGAAEPLGRIGATALAPTAVEARALYDRAAELLSDAARRAVA